MQTSSSRQQIQHELSRFIIIGLLATLADFLLYSLGHQWMPYALAKTCSFILGSCLAYFLNKYFTFKQKTHQKKQIFRFVALYVGTMCINVLINSISIAILTQWIIFPWLNHAAILMVAFVMATGASTVLNFIGQKFWVFTDHKAMPEFV